MNKIFPVKIQLDFFSHLLFATHFPSEILSASQFCADQRLKIAAIKEKDLTTDHLKLLLIQLGEDLIPMRVEPA